MLGGMAEFDEDAHPRDEKGRFAGGGGGNELKTWSAEKGARVGQRGGSGKGDLKTWSDVRQPRSAKDDEEKSEEAKPAEAKVEVEGHGAPLAPGRTWTNERVVGNADETWKEHYDKHPDEGGKPSAERKAEVHDPIVAKAFEGKKTAKELGQDKPVAILTMGGPASGKGVVLGQLKEHGMDTSKFVHVDPDAVKEQLPEYKASVPHPEHTDKKGVHHEGKDGPKGDGTGATFRGAAAQVHEESSDIAKRIRQEAMDKGHNVIVDGTGGNAANFTGLIDQLKSKGYDVHVHYPALDVETGVQRVEKRAEGSGRYVPEAVVRSTYAKIDKARDKIMDHIAKSGVHLKVYDAGTEGHPLAHERDGETGKETTHIPAVASKLGLGKKRE